MLDLSKNNKIQIYIFYKKNKFAGMVLVKFDPKKVKEVSIAKTVDKEVTSKKM